MMKLLGALFRSEANTHF